MKTLLSFLYAVLFISCTIAQNIDIQWRGSDRSGFFNETNLLKHWPDSGPEKILVVEELGRGYSSPVYFDNIIYIAGLKDTMDVLSAIDMSGNIQWQTPFGRSWVQSYPHSRSTPTISDGKIYLISGNGILTCIDSKKGNIIWQIDSKEKFGTTYGRWGHAESPLVVNDKVFITTGGYETTLVALDKNTGELIWKSESLQDTLAYVSPTFATHNNIEMIIGVTSRYIFGVKLNNGSLLWKYKYYDLERPTWHPAAPIINCVSPIYADGDIYLTSGYNHVGVRLDLAESAENVKVVWVDTVLDCHFGGVVLVDDLLYGASWTHNRDGDWCCIDWKTGEMKYREHWNNKGSIIYADGHLYIYDERKGTLGLVKPNPEKFDLVSSFKVKEGRGPHWAHPAIYDGKLFLRHGGSLMVYNIKEN